MTAGLPDAARHDTLFVRRILAGLLIVSISAAPARAHDGARSLEAEELLAPVQIVPTEENVKTNAPAPEIPPASHGPTAAAAPASSPALDQVIYKGVVGNLLEAVPFEPEQRVQLQRGNAVLSNTFAGRSLAVLLGVTSPVLMVGGLLWGIWAASQIKPRAEVTAPALVRQPPQAHVEAQAPQPAAKPAQFLPADTEPLEEPAQVVLQ